MDEINDLLDILDDILDEEVDDGIDLSLFARVARTIYAEMDAD